MQKLVEFKNSTKKVQKTLILYDVYKKKEDVSLNHLHAFAPKILDESMNIQAQPKGKNKVLYSIDPNGEEEMINIRRLGYDGSEKG